MTDHIIGAADEFLKPNQMESIVIDEETVLIVRDRNGDYYAMGATCTHAGAPLQNGILRDNTVVCPWHHSGFDVQCGARNQPPAIHNVPSYPMRVDDEGQLVVSLLAAPAKRLFNNHASNDLTVVIVGAGAAGYTAADELRRSGFRGRVVMLTAEDHPPIDRTTLSKGFLNPSSSIEHVQLRSLRWYKEQEIELILNSRVTDIETSDSLVRFRDENNSEMVLYYDRLILAMGSRAIKLPNVPPLSNVVPLRTLADAQRLIEQMKPNRHAVVVGGSFTGVEAAVALREAGLHVTVLEPSRIWFRDVFGDDVGLMLRDYHRLVNGMDVRRGMGVRRVMHENGRAHAVELDDWSTLQLDMLLVAVGVEPNTDFLRKGTILMADDGGVMVDKRLQTNVPGVYAVGDIATYENRLGSRDRMENWRLAQQHGMMVAHNIMGGDETTDSLIPFFWTNQGKDMTLGYVGRAADWDDIIYRGSVEERKFLAFYMKDNRPRAAAGVGHDLDLCALEIILRERLPLTRTQMQDESFDLPMYAQTMIKRVEMPRDL